MNCVELMNNLEHNIDEILIEWFNSLPKEEQDKIIDEYVRKLISAFARVIVKNQDGGTKK